MQFTRNTNLKVIALLVASIGGQSLAVAAPALGVGGFAMGTGTVNQVGNTTNVAVTSAGAKGVAVLNWQGGFNVSPSETVAFSSATGGALKNLVNVDTSGAASLVNGTIDVRGMEAGVNTLLVNQNGVTVGSSARVLGNSNSTSGSLGSAGFSVARGKVDMDGVAGTVQIDLTGLGVTGSVDMSAAPSIAGAAKVAGSVVAGVSDGVSIISSGAVAGPAVLPATLANDIGGGVLEAAGALVSNKLVATGNDFTTAANAMTGAHLTAGSVLSATNASHVYASGDLGSGVNLSGAVRNSEIDVHSMSIAADAQVLNSTLKTRLLGASTADLTGSTLDVNLTPGNSFGGFTDTGAGTLRLRGAGLNAVSNLSAYNLEIAAPGSLGLTDVFAGNKFTITALGVLTLAGNTRLNAMAPEAGGAGASVIQAGLLMNNAGNLALNSGNGGRYLVFLDDYNVGAKGGVNAGNLYNYTPGGLSAAAADLATNYTLAEGWGNRFVYKNAPTMNVKVMLSREYNGQAGGDYTIADYSTTPGGLGGLGLQVGGFRSADSGDAFLKPVVTGFTRDAGNNAGTYALYATTTSRLGYNISYDAASSYTITKATLTTGVASTASKVYDGTTAATVGFSPLTGVFAGDAVSLNAYSAYADKNAGLGKGVTSNLTLSGAQAGNYQIASTIASTGDIAKADLAVAAVADTKVYNGTTASLLSPVITGLLGGDTATGSQVFDSAAVGARTLNASAAISDGNGGGNYNVTYASAAGEILPAPAPAPVVAPVVPALPVTPPMATIVAPAVAKAVVAVVEERAAASDNAPDQKAGQVITQVTQAATARPGVCKR